MKKALRLVAFSSALTVAGFLTPLRAQSYFDGPQVPIAANVIDLETGDINQDGRPDLLFATSDTYTVGYLPSIGFGRFGTFVQQPGGSNGSSPTAGEFTSDGRTDLVSTVQGFLRVYPVGPGGSLGAPISTAISGLPNIATAWSRSQRVADLNLDGKNDVVFPNPGNGKVTYLLGNGAGGFSPQVDLALNGGAHAFEVEVGFLNADAWPDLVCSRQLAGSMGFSVFLSTGPATFAAPVNYVTSSDGVWGIAVGDFTGDGKPDVALSSATTIEVYRNTGNGAFAHPPAIPAPKPHFDVVIADMNEDGVGDLVFPNGPGVIHISLSLGGGAFSAGAEFPLGTAGSLDDIVVSDLDGDGHLDVARNCGGVAVSFGDGAGGLRSASILPSNYTRLTARADLNGDGLLDLVTGEASGPTTGMNQVGVRLRLPAGGFAPPVYFPTSQLFAGITLGFVDADPFIDVIATTYAARILVWLGNGSGGFAAPVTTTLNELSYSVAVADFNGDGLGDLIEIPDGDPQFPGGDIALHLGNGTGTFGTGSLTGVGLYATDPAVVDVDQDGDMDVVLAHVLNLTDLILLNNGSGTFTVLNFAPAAETNCVTMKDVNGDGRADFLGAYQELSVHLSLGGGAFDAGTVYPVNGERIDVGDVTGDGIVDIVSLSGAGYFTVLPGLGAGAFGAPSSYHTFGERAFEVLAIDNDARLDVVTCDQMSLIHIARAPNNDPLEYCVAKMNSLGCTPNMAWSGTSSATAASGFIVRADLMRNNKPGLLMYGVTGRAALPFSGGMQCIRGPVRRSTSVNSGGSSSGNDCTGVLAIDMNAFAVGALGGNPLPALLVPGTVVNCEFWGRDPGFPAPNNTTLSNALEYLIGS